jgi:hypothetical protein
MDPTDSPAWRTFIQDLKSKGIDFQSIQFADDASRSEIVAAVQGLGVMDRAVVSSTWARLGQSPQSRNAAPAGSFALSPMPTPSSVIEQNMSFGSPPRGTVVACDPGSLRAALNRGDATAALPLASELLQHDPSTLCLVLHEHLPHMGIDQIRSVLGLGAPTLSATQLQQTSSAANAAASMAPGTALLNGKPIQPGTVLTAQGLAAQYGHGFSATSNGLYLTFPYTVQRGDRVTVRPVTDRVL